MDELISQVSERTGLSTEDATNAAKSVIDFLKERLPDPIASQLDNFLSGESGGFGDMLKGLGGFFGRGGGDS